MQPAAGADYYPIGASTTLVMRLISTFW